MSTLINYVDSVFYRMQQTPEILKLKKEMLLNMEQRYDQLINENKSDQQAIGAVIAELGDFDELPLADDELNSEDTILVWARDDVEAFKSHRSTFSLANAVGVSLVSFAPALFLFIYMFAQPFPFFSSLSSSQLALFSSIPVLIVLAIAIGLFVAFGIKELQFDVARKVILIDSTTRSDLIQEKKDYKPQFAKGMTTGILFCTAGLFFLLFSLLLVGSSPFWSLIFLLSFVSIGVFFLVFFGIIYSTYDKLLSIGDYAPQKNANERLTTKVANLAFPIASGLYVISGLLFNTWSPGWMIFPILGICFGIFAVIIENPTLFSPKERRKKKR